MTEAAGQSKGRAAPLATILLVLLALWYVMSVVLNWDVVHTTNSEAANMPFLDVVALTQAHERPVLPAPHQVLMGLKTSVFDTAITSKRSLVYHGWVTLSSTLVGFLFGTLFGVVLAVLIVHSRLMNKSLMPWIIASQTVPILAIAPIIIVVLGSLGVTGLIPKAIISAYLSFFPVAIGMVKGLTSPDLLQLDLMRTYNASRNTVFWTLRLPASVPFLFASLKVAVAISLVGAIVGELPSGAEAGIGARLLSGSYYGQTVQIWAALVVAAVMAAALVASVALLERSTSKLMGARPS